MQTLIERIIRSRIARLVLSLALIALSAWAFFPYLTYRVAPSAYVNAELKRITAPIAGKLADDLPRKGEFIEQPETVKLIQTRLPDRRLLLDLSRRYDIAKSKADLARAQLNDVIAFDAVLTERLQTYQAGMTNRLREEMNEAAAETKGCLAEAKQRRDIGSRMEQLVKNGAASPIRSAEALASQEANTTKCEMADSRFKRFQAEMNSAQNGIFIRDGVNDVPYSQQQRDRLMIRRQELESQILDESSRASDLQAQLADEKIRADSMDHYDLTLPRDHVVWSMTASPGSSVTVGQTVLDLADCDKRFLAVELPGRDFERIRAGDTVAVRLIGSDEWRQGDIRKVRGSAARVDDRLLAAQIPNANPDNIMIEVGISSYEAAASRTNFCDIGRLAEVRFQRGGYGIFERLATLLRGLTTPTPTPESETVGQTVESQ